MYMSIYLLLVLFVCCRGEDGSCGGGVEVAETK